MYRSSSSRVIVYSAVSTRNQRRDSKLDLFGRNNAQPIAVLSEMKMVSDRWRVKPGIHVDKVNEELVCPKPRRPTNASSASPAPPPELLKYPSRKPSSSDGDVGFEILDIFLRKTSSGDASNFDCSPPYFCGSPPSRSGNPLIHDVQFIHQRSPAAPLVAQAGAASREPSRVSKPSVRVEGFVPSGSDSRSVPALA